MIAPEPAANDVPALAEAWTALAAASGVVTSDALAEEFELLFIGVGRPPVMLYGSYYQAGFMNEKPLAELRTDLVRMGFSRDGAVRETEDHLAALCDVMRALIMGDVASAPATLDEQRVPVPIPASVALAQVLREPAEVRRPGPVRVLCKPKDFTSRSAS